MQEKIRMIKDISKCNGNKCPKKNTCFRFTMEEGYNKDLSSFFNTLKGLDDECAFFIKNNEPDAN